MTWIKGALVLSLLLMTSVLLDADKLDGPIQEVTHSIQQCVAWEVMLIGAEPIEFCAEWGWFYCDDDGNCFRYR